MWERWVGWNRLWIVELWDEWKDVYRGEEIEDREEYQG